MAQTAVRRSPPRRSLKATCKLFVGVARNHLTSDFCAAQLEHSRARPRRSPAISDALRIFGEPNKYAKEDRLFDRGERARIIFDALREAPDGLDTKELAVIVMKAKRFDLDETELSDLRRLICIGMQRFLSKMRVKQGEMRDGVRMWRLA